MQIAVCDDEKEIRNMLAEKIQRLYPDAELTLYQSGVELLQANSQPDILFLDIQMEGKDGMETAREFRQKNKKTILIFVTALEEYVFQAFDVGAFHYLVKPFENNKFAKVLIRAVEECEMRKQEQAARSGAGAPKEAPSLMITTGGKHVAVNLEDIVYAEVFDRKIIIHTMDSDIEYYGKMKELEKAAGEDFYRPHRAYLVNFDFVRQYDAKTIYLEKGQALMAKQNYQDFVKCFLRYNRKKGEGQ